MSPNLNSSSSRGKAIPVRPDQMQTHSVWGFYGLLCSRLMQTLVVGLEHIVPKASSSPPNPNLTPTGLEMIKTS